MFIYLKDEDRYVHIAYDSDTIKEKLDTGIYDIEHINGYMLFKQNKAFDKGKVAEAGVFKQVKTYVNKYFSEEGKKVRKLMNQQTRLGLFFKGEPGTGKTFLAAKLAKQLIEKENGVAIYTSQLRGLDMTKVVDAIRQKDPDKMVVFILDEFEKDYDRLSGTERDALLAFLDGGKSRDNVVIIATVNSLRGIPATLLDRPGRFEKIVEFNITDDAVLTNLVEALIPDEITGVDTKALIKRAKTIKDLTIDKLKSLVRDSLTNFLATGELFLTKEEDLASMDKDDIKNQARRKGGKKRSPLNPLELLNRLTKGKEEETEDYYDN